MIDTASPDYLAAFMEAARQLIVALELENDEARTECDAEGTGGKSRDDD